MDNIPQQEAVAQPKAVKKDSNILMIIIIVLLSIILGIIIGLFIPFNEEVESSSNDNSQITSTKPTTAPTVEPTIALEKECTSNSFGTTFSIPSNWTCDVDDIDGVEPQTVISLEGDGVTIQVSNLGRGGPCSGIPEDNVPDCTLTDFYNSQYFDLTLYEQEGISLEIFGTFDVYSSWTSISWVTMDASDLTDAQETTIKAILDSVEVN